MWLKREKALLGVGKEISRPKEMVRSGAVMSNVNATFSQGRLIWLTGSVLVVREGRVLDILVSCGREVTD